MHYFLFKKNIFLTPSPLPTKKKNKDQGDNLQDVAVREGATHELGPAFLPSAAAFTALRHGRFNANYSELYIYGG